MGTILYIVVALGAFAIGGIIGWLWASREAASAKQTVESLRLQLDEVVKERNDAKAAHEQSSRELATFQADARNFEQRMKDLTASKDALIAQFREVGDQLLEKAHKDFLDKAGERLSKADQQSEAKLKSLLQPVEATLKRYEEGLQRVEKEREGSYRELNKTVELLRADQSSVKEQTAKLVNALRANPKTRGRWGEESLKNVLEQAGLNPYCDYRTEVSVDTDDGRLRPDVIIRLPGGGQIVVDAKCSLNAYLDACDEVDDVSRSAHLKGHLNSIKTHVQKLASKSYWEQFGSTADFVVMYIPGEHFLTAALEQDAKDKNDPPLWDWARERRVLLATPTNLLVIARLAATYWRQDQQTKQAAEIAKLGKELHSRLATMAEHIGSVGTNLSRANNAYNKMVGSLESQVLTQARRFEDFGAGGSKEILDLPIVEATPRALTKMTVVLPDDDPPQIAAE
ncbi:MAG: DNA recombination protein RmuC [Pseudomonadota bacterium]